MKNNMLTIAFKHHQDWLNIAYSFVANDFAEDLVQEFYIKLDKYAKYDLFIFADGTVNKSYGYLILRSLCINYLKEKSKYRKVDLKEVHDLDLSNIEQKEALEKIYNGIEDELKKWHWYDTKLFNLYKDQNISIRKLAKETDISTSSIFYTIKNCKADIKNKFIEDYEDYKNADYERI